ncbi:uncharacterized protein JN550_009913 [Neoarthrinium moseri]|uniref:uncharacterized protein n=1 Tax=Neoarthrinium moseri TaxID=1658444 RepID=UPI001FDCA48F|nr:uncharacterized protein JN550_009913 [Neoarthrinium moseri]KAI1862766.1 hypothetical protein JN550_009913 [Neoarthrinium moseri]
MAREWAAMSMDYKPLRVTAPKGKQRSSYWLQLRMKYSIPLLIVSVLLHWLLSNAIYISVGEGATLTLGIVFVVLILFPVFSMDRLKLPGGIPMVRTNSFAIAAACHVWPHETEELHHSNFHAGSNSMAQVSSLNTGSESEFSLGAGFEDSGNRSSHEMRSLTTPSDPNIVGSQHSDNTDAGGIEALVESEIKWGEVPMPPSWYAMYEHLDHHVGHLSFGSMDHSVKAPEEEGWYA